MKNISKKQKLILTLSIVLLLFLVSILYLNYKKYNVLKSSLERSISRSMGNMTSDCYDNKKLAESILSKGNVETNEAIIFNQRDSDFISILAMYSEIAEIKNGKNYNQITVKALLSEYNLASFNETISRKLTDDDKAHLKGKILIYGVIEDTTNEYFANAKSYLEKDNWYEWFKQMYEDILKLKFN
jgi:hypothetical protein